MSARENASARQAGSRPYVDSDAFLKLVAEVLDRLRSESEERGHPLLASLLEISKCEAEDDLKTQLQSSSRRLKHSPSNDSETEEEEGARRMAAKLVRAPHKTRP